MTGVHPTHQAKDRAGLTYHWAIDTMVLSKLFSWIRRLWSGSKQEIGSDLHTPRKMLRILDRERVRADRSGDPVAVVTFMPDNRDNHEETRVALVAVLPARMRCTDEIGWLDHERLCVVMPSTGMEGARKVIEEICLSVPAHLPPPIFTLYVYPQNQVYQERTADHQAVVEQQAVAEQPDRQTQPAGTQALAMESLLVRPMPFTKRAVDVLGALIGLILLAPLFLLVAVAIKLTSSGPVIFKQRRSGRGGKPFFMYKFRTMVVDAEARKAELMKLNEQDGPAFKIKNDPRVTRLGRLLRKTSLDELPQLWNVLMGEMSLVGPRPLPCSEAESCAGWQRQRLDVTPGITCIWQIWGRSAVSFDDWVRMDVQYIRSQSLPQDLKLLFCTVPAVLLRKGAH